MNPFIKKILYLLFLGIAPTGCNATILFSNNADTFALNQTNGKLGVSNPAKIIGWTNRSIVKAFGDNASSSWPEAYTSNTVIAQSGAGVTPARTMLVNANSNAINTTGTTLRTTSNLLLYTARTYSSSIIVLRQRSDSTNQTIRTTSNAVNLFYRNINNRPIADSIDGTQFMQYCTNHYVFHNGTYNARGWVRFNNGFTVMPQGTVLMDTLTTVSGPIDLRDTGYLALNNDLYLAHNVTLTSGGYIEGQAGMGGVANTIFMGGDLTLASDSYGKVLHITGNWNSTNHSGDTIIDGCGHTLTIGDWGQIFVDQNVTLTLRNMTIRTSGKSPNKPAILLAAHTSKLALDNVVFELGADFQFKQGQLFIHDEVAVTGTSAFIYTSPKPSYITSGATWSFETGTTFSIAPSTYTDQPYTAGTNTSNNFIVLADQSAALSLSNCSLKTTFTGARLSKGMILFDNKVTIDTQAAQSVSGLGSGTGLLSVTDTVSGAVFSPDGRYVATTYVNGGTATIQIDRFNGSSLSYVTKYGYGTTDNAPAIAWSPDGQFLAWGSNSLLAIYRFDGSTTILGNRLVTNVSFGLLVNSIAWSPDGRYLAVGGNNGSTPLIIYRFNGTSLTQVTTRNPATGTSQINGVAWSPDGKYLGLVGHYLGGALMQVCSFDGSTLTTATSDGELGNGVSFTWSPDGRYFVWSVSRLSDGIRLCQFNGTGFTPITIAGNQCEAVSFSPDGRYLMACGSTTAYLFRIPNFTTPIAGIAFATIATTVAWSPDSKYVLVGGTNGTTDLMVYPVNYVYTNQPAQGFSNGLLFGDKAQGAGFDANVQIHGSAVVKVKGMVKDDSF